MKDFLISMAFVVLSFGMGFLLCASLTNKHNEVRYDCRALHGGWHPDVPIEVQKKCRELK